LKKEAAERKRAEDEFQKRLDAERQAQTQAEAANALQAAAGRIKAAIEENWRRPGTSRVGLSALLQLKVAPNGDVVRVKIIRSSGDPFFDQSAEIAVKKASPLPIPTNPKYYEHLNEFNIEFNPDE